MQVPQDNALGSLLGDKNQLADSEKGSCFKEEIIIPHQFGLGHSDSQYLFAAIDWPTQANMGGKGELVCFLKKLKARTRWDLLPLITEVDLYPASALERNSSTFQQLR